MVEGPVVYSLTSKGISDHSNKTLNEGAVAFIDALVTKGVSARTELLAS